MNSVRDAAPRTADEATPATPAPKVTASPIWMVNEPEVFEKSSEMFLKNAAPLPCVWAPTASASFASTQGLTFRKNGTGPRVNCSVQLRSVLTWKRALILPYAGSLLLPQVLPTQS